MRRSQALRLLLLADGEALWAHPGRLRQVPPAQCRAFSDGKEPRREPKFDPRMLAAGQGQAEGPALAGARPSRRRAGPPRQRERTGAAAQVLRFHPDGSHTEERASPQQLGLGPRDVSLFVTGSKASSTQRATITPRPGCILLRTEMVRAIVRQTTAVVFPSRWAPAARRALLAAALCGLCSAFCLSASASGRLESQGPRHHVRPARPTPNPRTQARARHPEDDRRGDDRHTRLRPPRALPSAERATGRRSGRAVCKARCLLLTTWSPCEAAGRTSLSMVQLLWRAAQRRACTEDRPPQRERRAGGEADGTDSALIELPFELRVVEALLAVGASPAAVSWLCISPRWLLMQPGCPDCSSIMRVGLQETVRQFESRRQRIALLSHGAGEDFSIASPADIYRLLPIQRCTASSLTSAQHPAGLHGACRRLQAGCRPACRAVAEAPDSSEFATLQGLLLACACLLPWLRLPGCLQGPKRDAARLF